MWAPTPGLGDPWAEETVRVSWIVVKLAVTWLGPVMVKLWGLLVEAVAPVQLEKAYPPAGEAVSRMLVPALYQGPDGLAVAVPPAAGLDVNVS